MKSIQVDKDILDHLLSHAANPGEAAAAILRRELRVPQAQVMLDVDDETYAFIASKSRAIGETASDILRRELNLAGPPSPNTPDVPGGPDPHAPPNARPERVLFKIAAGTGSGAWNSRDTMIVARKGDTLQIMNDDTVTHQLYTSGGVFALHTIGGVSGQPGTDIRPGMGEEFLLETTYDPVQQGPLYDHRYGEQAQFWLRVVDNA